MSIFENPKLRVETCTATGRADPSRLAALENRIERGLTTFVEVGNAIWEIRDSRLYKEQYKTFEDYCRERWGWSRIHAHRHIEAANAAAVLLPVGNIPNERVAREIAPLAKENPDAAREVWAEAVKDAEERGVALTAKDIKQAVKNVVKSKTKDPRRGNRGRPLRHRGHGRPEGGRG